MHQAEKKDKSGDQIIAQRDLKLIRKLINVNAIRYYDAEKIIFRKRE